MRHKLLPLLAAAVVLVAGDAVRADVPRIINFSGRISDSSGTPIDVPITIEFSIWDDPAADEPPHRCYSRTEVGYMPTKGYVMYHLDTVGGTCDFARPYWLQIQIGTDPPMLPRLPLAAVAYAITTQGLVEPSTGIVHSDVGNLPDQIPIGNGEVNQGLNVGMIDGNWWDDFAYAGHRHGQAVCAMPVADCGGITRLFAQSAVEACPAGSTLVGYLPQ